MRILIYTILFIPLISSAQTSVMGHIYDAVTQASIKYGTVALLKDGRIIKGVETNLEGYFELEGIPAGQYDLEASYVGYTAKRIKCVIHEDKTAYIQLLITEGTQQMSLGCFPDWRQPLLEFDATSSGATYLSKDMRRMPLPR